jgi:hypothetical protein
MVVVEEAHRGGHVEVTYRASPRSDICRAGDLGNHPDTAIMLRVLYV